MTTAVPVSLKHWSVFFPIVTAALAAMVFAGLAGVATTKGGYPSSRFFRLSLRPPAAAIVRAVAPGAASGDMCVMALGTSGRLSVKEAVTVGLTNCDLYNNSHKAASTELVGEASLSARNIFLSGSYALSPGTLMTASGALATHTSPVSDPYIGLTAPGYSGCTKTRFALDAGITERTSPGVYCGGILVAGGAVLDLAPGTYILDEGNFEVGENATVMGRDVTIILTSRTRSNYGVVDFQRGATIKLSAPASGSEVGAPGIALWVDAMAPMATNAIDGGGAQIIDGAVYLPSQEVSFSGGSPLGTRCSQLIARTVSFTGDAYFRHDCAGAGISDPIPPPRFVEE
jgi:hypothetical protein